MTIAKKQVLISTHHISITFPWQCDQISKKNIWYKSRHISDIYLIEFLSHCHEIVLEMWSHFFFIQLHFHDILITILGKCDGSKFCDEKVKAFTISTSPNLYNCYKIVMKKLNQEKKYEDIELSISPHFSIQFLRLLSITFSFICHSFFYWYWAFFLIWVLSYHYILQNIIVIPSSVKKPWQFVVIYLIIQSNWSKN